MAKMRSPNYPAAGLGQCIGWAKLLWAKEKRTQVSPTEAAKAIGYGALHGPARSALSAMKKFGLLNEVKDNVQLSDRAMVIIHHPETDYDYRVAVREAAVGPDIFRELLETHADASDDTLKSHLIVRKSFTDEGARQFIRAFRDTLDIAKLPDSRYDPSMARDNSEASTDRGIAGSGLTGSSKVVAGQGDSHGQSHVQGVGIGMNSDTFTLDEGQVVLQWPAKMSPESYEDFKAWLDLMAKRIKRASEKTDPSPLASQQISSILE